MLYCERVAVRTYSKGSLFLFKRKILKPERKIFTPGVPPGICQNHQDCDNFIARFDFLFDSNATSNFSSFVRHDSCLGDGKMSKKPICLFFFVVFCLRFCTRLIVMHFVQVIPIFSLYFVCFFVIWTYYLMFVTTRVWETVKCQKNPFVCFFLLFFVCDFALVWLSCILCKLYLFFPCISCVFSLFERIIWKKPGAKNPSTEKKLKSR